MLSYFKWLEAIIISICFGLTDWGLVERPPPKVVTSANAPTRRGDCTIDKRPHIVGICMDQGQ